MFEFLQRLGLFGIFIIMLLSNASLFVVVPGDMLLFLGATKFNPIILSVVAAAGASLGELTSYFAGYVGNKTVERIKKENSQKLEKISKQLEDKKYSFFTIFFAALTPFPFDIVGIAAGLMRYDLKKFIIPLFLGKLVRYLLISFAGFFGITFILPLFGIKP